MTKLGQGLIRGLKEAARAKAWEEADAEYPGQNKIDFLAGWDAAAALYGAEIAEADGTSQLLNDWYKKEQKLNVALTARNAALVAALTEIKNAYGTPDDDDFVTATARAALEGE